MSCHAISAAGMMRGGGRDVLLRRLLLLLVWLMLRWRLYALVVGGGRRSHALLGRRWN